MATWILFVLIWVLSFGVGSALGVVGTVWYLFRGLGE